jgi:hypothetical protein
MNAAVTKPDSTNCAAAPRGVALYIDPPSHHFLGNRLFIADDGRATGDCNNTPFVYLREHLTPQGIPVHTADYLPPEEGDVRIVYVSMGILANYRRLARRRDVVLSACYPVECPIVEPSIFAGLREAQRYFKRVYCYSDSASLERFVGGPLRCLPCTYPQAFEEVHAHIWGRTDRQFLVMINGNKLPRIPWQELYTERLRALAFFHRFGEIELYGLGWQEPPYRVGKTWVPYTFRALHRKGVQLYWRYVRDHPLWKAAREAYRGPARSKRETLGRYTFALCFENMILKSWITEKIFDCFYAGTVPIYWGAPDITDHVPNDCFIDMRQFASYEELRSYLKSLGEGDVHRYKEAARDYLRSPQAYPFSKRAFVEIFTRILAEDAGVELDPPPGRPGRALAAAAVARS